MPNKQKTLLWIDVLGFGKEIEQSEIDDAVDEYDKLINRYLGKYSGVEFDIVSDSLLFWPKSSGNQYTDISNIVLAAHLYSSESLIQVIPKHSLIRGSIVFDEFIVDQREHEHHFTVHFRSGGTEERVDRMNYHRIIGKAIVKAHRWESLQDWCLISIDPSYNSIIENPSVFPKHLIDNNYVIKYQIPTKNGQKEGYVVNPFMKEYCLGFEKLSPGVNDQANLPIIDGKVEVGKLYEKCLNKHLEKNQDEHAARTKIQNTVEFFRYVVDNQIYVTGNMSP